MKEKLFRFSTYVFVAALTAAVTLGLAELQFGLKPTKLEQLEDLIQQKFIGEAEATALEDAAAAAMVAAAGDRWSYYIPASEYQAYRERMDNAYVGVGITIQPAEDQQGFLIVEVNAKGPAAEAGIQVKDLLIEVEGQSLREMTAADVRTLVQGPAGTYVNLTVMRKGEHQTLAVERRQIENPVATWTLLDGNVGLVTIENFDSRCAQETIAAIEALLEQGAQKLIFDVRHNPGGYADELVKVLDYLLPEGELFHTIDYAGKEHIDQSDPEHLELPMAVLVNSDSYSAAEFFAAALSEYEAALVVGEQTVGKGYFQTTYQLNDGSAVALSIGEYFTPKGKNLANIGITPDVEVPVDEETAAEIYYGTLAPEEDPQIQAAVKALNRRR